MTAPPDRVLPRTKAGGGVSSAIHVLRHNPLSLSLAVLDVPTMLTPDARHLVKTADLDGLEQFARQAGDQIDTSASFENIFEALDQQAKLSPEVVLDWGARYIAWARSFPDRDGLPFLGTAWARRLFERAVSAGRRDLALSVVEAVLASYAPLERERSWWQAQHRRLTSIPTT